MSLLVQILKDNKFSNILIQCYFIFDPAEETGVECRRVIRLRNTALDSKKDGLTESK